MNKSKFIITFRNKIIYIKLATGEKFPRVVIYKPTASVKNYRMTLFKEQFLVTHDWQNSFTLKKALDNGMKELEILVEKSCLIDL